MSKDALKSLTEWFEIYIKHRDLILKKLVSIDIKENHLNITFKDKVQDCFVYLNAKNIDFEELKKYKNPCLVLLNSEGNFSHILTEWSKCITIPHLCIYFVNPFSELDKKWIVFPYTHHQISEEESLAKGLRALHESVEAIDEETYSLKV